MPQKTQYVSPTSFEWCCETSKERPILLPILFLLLCAHPSATTRISLSPAHSSLAPYPTATLSLSTAQAFSCLYFYSNLHQVGIARVEVFILNDAVMYTDMLAQCRELTLCIPTKYMYIYIYIYLSLLRLTFKEKK